MIPETKSLPPKLILLPSQSSKDWTNGTLTNKTVWVEYGKISDINFGPCTSLNEVNRTSAPSCAAVALFATGSNITDLTPFINVADISNIQNQTSCNVTELTLGTCLPGSYTLSYSATNSLGATATAYLLVLVETRSSSFFNYTFSPSEVNTTSLQDVTAYSDALIANQSVAASVITLQLPYL